MVFWFLFFQNCRRCEKQHFCASVIFESISTSLQIDKMRQKRLKHLPQQVMSWVAQWVVMFFFGYFSEYRKNVNISNTLYASKWYIQGCWKGGNCNPTFAEILPKLLSFSIEISVLCPPPTRWQVPTPHQTPCLFLLVAIAIICWWT